MPEISDGLANFALEELRARGIEVRLGTTVDEVTEHSVTLSPGEHVPARTLVWTAGVAPQPVTAELGLELEPAGRIVVDQYLQVSGHDNIWALGDAAAVPDPKHRGERPCPPTAQHAMRQGKVAAHNVAATVGRGRIRPFTYKTLGVFVDMGRKQAVAETLGIKWRGAPAWFLARSYHLLQLPGAARKATAAARLDDRPRIRSLRVRGQPARRAAGPRQAAGIACGQRAGRAYDSRIRPRMMTRARRRRRRRARTSRPSATRVHVRS